MKKPPIILARVATYVGVGYLAGAIGHRLLPGVRALDALAPLYWSLPGALAGCAFYAAWTGLRSRSQSALGMVSVGAFGMVLEGLVVRRLPAAIQTLVPGTPDRFVFYATAFYETLCDLSAIAFLFALFLAAFVPASRLPVAVEPQEPARKQGS